MNATDAALLMRHRQAEDELREQLSMALARIDVLEAQLEARRRAEAEQRLAQGVDRTRPPRRGPRPAKPLRPHTDSEWAKTLEEAHTKG
jgi:hypothetical protein